MKDSSLSANPLYEKLYNRFSYSGKTVGEMMLSRAREEGKVKSSELSEITAETCITRANALPKKEGGTACVAVRRPLAFSLRRINPSAALAVLLLSFIVAYLLVAGISHRIPRLGEGLLDTPAADIQLYTPCEPSAIL